MHHHTKARRCLPKEGGSALRCMGSKSILQGSASGPDESSFESDDAFT